MKNSFIFIIQEKYDKKNALYMMKKPFKLADRDGLCKNLYLTRSKSVATRRPQSKATFKIEPVIFYSLQNE